MAFEKRSQITGCGTARTSLGLLSSSDVLDDFVKRGTSAGVRQPVPLPARLTAALWFLAGLDALVALWMYAVHTARMACANTLCSITTLGAHEVVLGLLAAASLAGLLILAVATGGYRRVGLPAVATVCVFCIATFAAALGLVLAALVVVTTVAVAGLLLLAFVLAFSTP